MGRVHFRVPFFFHYAMHTGPMDELEGLRALIGPEADHLTMAQLEQLQRDIDALAALLLDEYASRKGSRSVGACGS